VSDLLQIQPLPHSYCHARDYPDTGLLGRCFGSEVELLGAQGPGAVVDRYAEGCKHLTAQRRHVLTNIFAVPDADATAVVKSCITLYLIQDQKLEPHLIDACRDHVVVEDGQWRVRRRDSVMEAPYNLGDVAPAPAGGRLGR
jgi:hypothetical protein